MLEENSKNIERTIDVLSRRAILEIERNDPFRAHISGGYEFAFAARMGVVGELIRRMFLQEQKGHPEPGETEITPLSITGMLTEGGVSPAVAKKLVSLKIRLACLPKDNVVKGKFTNE